MSAHRPFRMTTEMQPAGDQPGAVRSLVGWLQAGHPHCTLLGVTGSGKTFTMAKVIDQLQRPALVLAPNKTLAAQLFSEFRSFFPDNAVEYFVSYYDYYQPEAYVPTTDTYIEKDALINEAISMPSSPPTARTRKTPAARSDFRSTRATSRPSSRNGST